MPAWMPSSVNVPGSTRQVEALARGELVRLVLRGDLLLAAAEPRLGAALVEVLDERAQDRRRGSSVAHGAAPRARARPAAARAARRQRAACSGVEKQVTSQPTIASPRGDVGEQVAQLLELEAAGRRVDAGRAARPGRGCRGRGGRTPRGPPGAPASCDGRLGRARRRARVQEHALAGVEVAHRRTMHDPRGIDAGARGRCPTRRTAPARHMPPRKPLGVVSGVLKSPWASSHRTRASGRGARRPAAS